MHELKGITRHEICFGPYRPPRMAHRTLPSVASISMLSTSGDVPLVTSDASRPLGTAGRTNAFLHRNPP